MLEGDDAIREIARLSSVLDATASSHWAGNESRGRMYTLAEDPFNFSKAFTSFSVIGPVGAVSQKRAFLHQLVHWLLQIPFRYKGIALKGFWKFDPSRRCSGWKNNKFSIFPKNVKNE